MASVTMCLGRGGHVQTPFPSLRLQAALRSAGETGVERYVRSWSRYAVGYQSFVGGTVTTNVSHLEMIQ